MNGSAGHRGGERDARRISLWGRQPLFDRLCSKEFSPPYCGQKITFPANQKVRCPVRLPASLENWGPLAVDVMTPKFELFDVENVVLGLPKFGVLVTANALTRNWKFTRSVIRKFRRRPVSKSKKPGPRRMLRPAVP